LLPVLDDDGQGYFVGTQFSQNYKTYIFKMTPDGRDIIKSSAVLINEGRGREANKLYKWNGWYYHFFSEVGGDGGRYIMMQRARNIFGPYSEKKQLTHTNREANEPNQGGIIQTPQGGWYFLTHHGHGDWSGRVMSLLPVTWIDGWPIIGKVGQDGIGDMAWSGRKPVQRTHIELPKTDDTFKGKELLPQWEWNYQPRPEKWSLEERRGWLRLHAFKPLRPHDLLKAGNTLTQRVFRSDGVATVKVDITNMADGQAAGLCQYGGRYAWLGVAQEAGVRYLTYNFNGTATRGPALTGALLWLQTRISLDGYATWAYSLDGRTFTPFGEGYRLEWANYRGSRLGIFTYNDNGEAGYVDVDEFQYHFDGPHR
jgi:beta-xylosidase